MLFEKLGNGNLESFYYHNHWLMIIFFHFANPSSKKERLVLMFFPPTKAEATMEENGLKENSDRRKSFVIIGAWARTYI